MNARQSKSCSSRPALYLSPHIFTCMVGGSLVFLDVKKDRYFGLNTEASRRVRALLATEAPDTADDAAPEAEHRKALIEDPEIAGLIEEKILTANASVGKPFQPIDGPPDLREAPGLLPDERPKLKAAHVAAFLGAYASANIRLRLFGLEHSVNYLKRCKQRLANTPTGNGGLTRLKELIEMFRLLKPLAARGTDACLINSLALATFLAAHGFKTEFCIGVRLDEFGAHAWLQHEDLVLDDFVYAVAPHTRILTV
ncbi:lasso peptide biosynthesis B2 protein [Hyphococcus luteus]|uniref:Microcin J25-processing protein McjB C-terminal domain-containing protein n=1 Tax=Hyphococcus luteus TaxID=2058213 RepID=A0A2S7K410_9PROT|nr:lasso peptide biosynthesis B2 protein [Marinicaulis flavus]PQA87178.1 hypothetical protein CW354_14155 [Marinicaulis flavus]